MTREKVMQLVERFEAEINNGGFHQFFYNSTGDETSEIIRALEIIKAVTVADIVKRAAAKFPNGMPPKDRLERQTLLLDRVDAEIKVFDGLNQEFYAYPEDLTGLLEKYMG